MKHLYLLFFLGTFIQAFSQEDPLYVQYINNPMILNPAYAGLNNNFNASVSYRKQWGGFEGSPTTFHVSGHTSLAKNKMGLGILLIQDKTGANSNTEMNMTYAYRLNFNGTHLSFGMQAGFINYKTDNTLLNTYDPTDPAFNSDINVIRPNVGAGVILNSEKFFAGISVPRMLNTTTLLSTDTASMKARLYDQHYYGSFGYVFYLSTRMRLRPSCLVRYVQGAPLSVDYTVAINLDEKYTAGLYTRNLNAGGFLLQLRFAGAYRFGYAFEVPLNNNTVATRFNTHELTLGINLSLFSFQSSSITNF